MTWGSGVSIDQFVTPAIGLFFRGGVSRSEGEDGTSRAWAGGVQVAPNWGDRANDRLGIGYSFQREPIGREAMVETYYTLALADWLRMTANLEWVISGPNQVNAGTNRHVLIPGVRATILF